MISSNFALHRVQIGHASVHACQFEEAASAILSAALRKDPQYIVTPNVQHIALLAKDKYLRQVYAEAAFVLPDGVSLLLAARVLGERIPQRISGVDMFQTLCQQAALEGLRVFLLGGRPGSVEKASAKLQRECPGLIIAGTHCPPIGFENDCRQEEEIETRIRVARPHLLFVAFGAPKQEYWMHKHARQLRVPITMGVGGSFEMVGEVIGRAPRWVQTIGFEWMYRLLREPRRLWRRYLFDTIQFAQIVIRQRLNAEEGARA